MHKVLPNCGTQLQDAEVVTSTDMFRKKLDQFREDSLNGLITVSCLLPPSAPSIYHMPLSDTEYSSWLFIHFTTATAKCSAPKKEKGNQL